MARIAEPTETTGCEIVGNSGACLALVTQLRRVAATAAPVLLEGETGTGKELAARSVHYWSARRCGPFVPVNCGSIPETLIESELFGHERGAFTDARVARAGLAVQADCGTLFLDEVDSLSPKAQVTLLRFLQDHRFRPVGATREFTADVRVVAATNRGLEDEVAQGRFRADLMYRLRILQVRLPPLRERERDVECLARHFAAVYAKKYRVPLRCFSDEALAWMARHPWPGNVRELENWVHRSMILGDGDTIDAAAPPTLAAPPGHADQTLALPGFRDAKLAAIARFERDYLEAALRRTGGNLTQAARLAGKERRDFSRLVKKHGIGPDIGREV